MSELDKWRKGSYKERLDEHGNAIWVDVWRLVDRAYNQEGLPYIAEIGDTFLCRKDISREQACTDEVMFDGQAFETVEQAIVALKVSGYV